MKPVRSIFFILVYLLLLLPCNIYPETTKTESIFFSENGEIKIAAVSYEMDMKNSIITFNSDVDVATNDMTMSCQKLELHFTNTVNDASIKSGKYSIDKIIATESVIIKRPDIGYVTAEKAEYLKNTEKIILTGNPYYKYGEGREGSGKRITLDLKEGHYIVEGTKDDRAKFFSTGEKER